jgi:hypothetical protein
MEPPDSLCRVATPDTGRDDQKFNIQFVVIVERYSISREAIRKIHVVGKIWPQITAEVKIN